MTELKLSWRSLSCSTGTALQPQLAHINQQPARHSGCRRDTERAVRSEINGGKAPPVGDRFNYSTCQPSEFWLELNSFNHFRFSMTIDMNMISKKMKLWLTFTRTKMILETILISYETMLCVMLCCMQLKHKTVSTFIALPIPSRGCIPIPIPPLKQSFFLL